MNENRRKEVFMQKPIERHDTASWADVEKTKPVSKVLVPKEIGVLNAKEYVDENDKYKFCPYFLKIHYLSPICSICKVKARPWIDSKKLSRTIKKTGQFFIHNIKS